MKKYKLIWPVITGLLFAITATSCNMIGLVNDYPGKNLSEAVDNRDIRLLNYAPQVKEMVESHVKTPEQAASFQAFAADMIKKTEAADPDFYNEFVKKVDSGDPKLCAEAVKEGLEKLTAQFKDYCGDQNLTEEQIFNKIFTDY